MYIMHLKLKKKTFKLDLFSLFWLTYIQIYSFSMQWQASQGYGEPTNI